VKRSGTADLPLHGGRVPPWLAERMTKLGIYPTVIWKRPEETDAPRGFLLDAFTGLRDFVADAAREDHAIVVCIS